MKLMLKFEKMWWGSRDKGLVRRTAVHVLLCVHSSSQQQQYSSPLLVVGGVWFLDFFFFFFFFALLLFFSSLFTSDSLSRLLAGWLCRCLTCWLFLRRSLLVYLQLRYLYLSKSQSV